MSGAVLGDSFIPGKRLIGQIICTACEQGFYHDRPQYPGNPSREPYPISVAPRGKKASASGLFCVWAGGRQARWIGARK